MKRYYIAAAVIAAIDIAVYPLMKNLAYMERGYEAHGGEDVLLIFGFLMACMVISVGHERTLSARENQSMMFWTCANCGANLDHGEKCDCAIKKDRLPSGNLPYTESEQSGTNHFDAKPVYHRRHGSVNQAKGE